MPAGSRTYLLRRFFFTLLSTCQGERVLFKITAGTCTSGSSSVTKPTLNQAETPPCGSPRSCRSLWFSSWPFLTTGQEVFWFQRQSRRSSSTQTDRTRKPASNLHLPSFSQTHLKTHPVTTPCQEDHFSLCFSSPQKKVSHKRLAPFSLSALWKRNRGKGRAPFLSSNSTDGNLIIFPSVISNPSYCWLQFLHSPMQTMNQAVSQTNRKIGLNLTLALPL